MSIDYHCAGLHASLWRKKVFVPKLDKGYNMVKRQQLHTTTANKELKSRISYKNSGFICQPHFGVKNMTTPGEAI
jgi:hypothetical protein